MKNNYNLEINGQITLHQMRFHEYSLLCARRRIFKIAIPCYIREVVWFQDVYSI